MEATNTNARFLSITTPNPGNHDRIALTSASPLTSNLTLIGSSAKSAHVLILPPLLGAVASSPCRKAGGGGSCNAPLRLAPFPTLTTST